MESSILLVAIALLSLFSLVNAAGSTDADTCKHLGYNTNAAGGLLVSEISKKRALSSLEMLSAVGCSNLARHLTCAVLYPPRIGFYGSIPPCKSVCQAVIQSCDSFQKISSIFSQPSQGAPGPCKHTKKGTLFRGKVSETKNGLKCQKWDSQTPHNHTTVPGAYPKADLTNDYCRNPDGEPDGPWCYTTSKNVRWGYCDVPLCKSSPLCEKFPSSGCFQFIRSQLSARNRVNVGVVPGASQLFRWRLLLLSMGNSGIRMMRNLIGSQSAVSQLGKLLQG